MKRFKALISSRHMNSVIEEYRDVLARNNIEATSIIRPQIVTEEELLAVIDEYDGIICSDDQLTEAVLEKATKLKVISKWGVGIDSIDLKAAKRLGIAVYNTPEAFSESAATVVWGMIINLTRHLMTVDSLMRAGEWKKITGISLTNKVLGVIGVGSIGKAVIKRGSAFDMKILGNDIKGIDQSFCQKYNVEMVSKEELLRTSDVISLSVDLNERSYHLISTEELSLMKPTAYLINTSRGPVVDERALVKALEEKRLAGAGLDVFENEPLPLDSPLRSFENCILNSHNAYNTEEAVTWVHQNTVNNLIKGLRESTK